MSDCMNCVSCGAASCAEVERLRAEVLDRRAERVLERLRGENDHWRDEAKSLGARLMESCERNKPLRAENRRLRAVLAETPENVTYLLRHVYDNGSANPTGIIKAILAALRAQTGMEPKP